MLSLSFFIPILAEFERTGLVQRLPTLIICGFALLASLISLFSGWILETMAWKNRQDFEMWRNVWNEKHKQKLFDRKME